MQASGSSSPEKRSIRLSPLCPDDQRPRISFPTTSSSSTATSHSGIAMRPRPMGAASRPITRSAEGSHMSMKGKDRDLGAAIAAEQDSMRTASWVIDVLQAKQGRERWSQTERVILVLGDVSPDSLAPILYNPNFENTLLIIGTPDPLPSIQALMSPSYLLFTNPDQRIYPTIQPISLPPGSPARLQLPAILEMAVEQSKSWRSSNKRRDWSRRSSESSSMNTGGPLTPPTRIRQMSFASFRSRGSERSLSSLAEGSEVGDNTLPLPSRPTSTVNMFPSSNSEQMLGNKRDSTFAPRSRLTSFRGDSIFGGLSKLAGINNDDQASTGSSGPTLAFDAVINFVPLSGDKNPQTSLTQMLHQAVLATTGVFPLLHKKASAIDQFSRGLPVTIAHVVPIGCPPNLPLALQSFLLDFSKNFQGSERVLWPSVITQKVWKTWSIDAIVEEDLSSEEVGPTGADLLLFGGVRCPTEIVVDQGIKIRGQAYLSSWKSCISMPGLLSTTQSPAIPSLRDSHTRKPSTTSAYIELKPATVVSNRPSSAATVRQTPIRKHSDTTSVGSTRTSPSIPELMDGQQSPSQSCSSSSSISGETTVTPIPLIEGGGADVWTKSNMV